jgi:hypothetical protein
MKIDKGKPRTWGKSTPIKSDSGLNLGHHSENSVTNHLTFWKPVVFVLLHGFQKHSNSSMGRILLFACTMWWKQVWHSTSQHLFLYITVVFWAMNILWIWVTALLVPESVWSEVKWLLSMKHVKSWQSRQPFLMKLANYFYPIFLWPL